MARQTYTARLLRKTCLSESAQCFHLEFVIDELESFDLTSGQFLSAVAVDGNGKTQTRAYSIASAPNTNRFDLCVNRVEGGFFSNHLCDLESNGSVQIHGPHGHFILHAPVTDSIFVATGTGIAPMRGFTQWLFPQEGPHAGADRSGGKDIWLVYGTRHESDLYYRSYFEKLAAKHHNFHYISTLSRAPDEWPGLRGYVQQYVGLVVEKRSEKLLSKVAEAAAEEAMIEATETAIETLPVFDIHTYICGLNNMVSGVRERLTELGWHRKQIIFERYD